jgi:hypothetical protein
MHASFAEPCTEMSDALLSQAANEEPSPLVGFFESRLVSSNQPYFGGKDAIIIDNRANPSLPWAIMCRGTPVSGCAYATMTGQRK